MKAYCYQCGQGMDYVGASPNFCMRCGVKIGDLHATLQEDAIEDPIEEIKAKIDQEKPLETIPDITALEVEVEIPSNSITLGEIAGTIPSSQNKDDFKTLGRKKVSKKKFLENFQKEAGSLRKKGEKT